MYYMYNNNTQEVRSIHENNVIKICAKLYKQKKYNHSTYLQIYVVHSRSL